MVRSRSWLEQRQRANFNFKSLKFETEPTSNYFHLFFFAEKCDHAFASAIMMLQYTIPYSVRVLLSVTVFKIHLALLLLSFLVAYVSQYNTANTIIL